jgi:hypothetical protein
MGCDAEWFGDFRQRADVAIMGTASCRRHRTRSGLGRTTAAAIRHAVNLGCRPCSHADGSRL